MYVRFELNLGRELSMAVVAALEQSNVSSMSRQSQLLEIMRDAATHVLQRDALRRGPYIIDDKDLKPSQDDRRK